MISNLVIFAFLTGLISVGVILGAISWAKDLGLNMNWWKWLLSAIWYILFLFLVFAAFTFIGEGEPAAGWKLLGITALLMVILGTALVRILAAGRNKRLKKNIL